MVSTNFTRCLNCPFEVKYLDMAMPNPIEQGFLDVFCLFFSLTNEKSTVYPSILLTVQTFPKTKVGLQKINFCTSARISW